MARELSHGEVQDLLGAFALDAVDDDEREAVARHLEGCRPCQAEVADHREVVSLMAAGFVPAPEGVWDRIASSLEEAPPAMRLGGVVSLDDERARRSAERERRRGPWAIAAAVAAVAAVAVVGVLGMRIIDTGNRVNDIADGLASEDVARLADAAARRTDAKTIALRSSDGKLVEEAVLLPDGTGFLKGGNLPALPDNRTYQLWAVVGSNKISVGVLGSSVGPTAFRADADVSALAITDEVAGGVVESRQQPTVVGLVA
ncbi:MAG: anti-sigma factor domain-containing protein [Acidimicrobiales bacterium]